jgi:hypothetical protein
MLLPACSGGCSILTISQKKNPPGVNRLANVRNENLFSVQVCPGREALTNHEFDASDAAKIFN